MSRSSSDPQLVHKAALLGSVSHTNAPAGAARPRGRQRRVELPCTKQDYDRAVEVPQHLAQILSLTGGRVVFKLENA